MPSSAGVLFSDIQDEVMRIAHCPVVVARLLGMPSSIKTILIPIETPSVMTLRVLRFAQVLGAANRAKITLLHVYSPRTTKLYQTRVRKQLEILLERLPSAEGSIEIEMLARDSTISAIAKASRQYDLTIVRSQRRHSGNGFTIGEKTMPLVQQLSGSVILVGEPQSQPVRQPARRKQPSPELLLTGETT